MVWYGLVGLIKAVELLDDRAMLENQEKWEKQ
jgi:hypothetical protein